MNCLIDGDVVLYVIGFASQQSNYISHGEEFSNKKDLNMFLAYNNHNKDDYEVHIIPDPAPIVLNSVDKYIENIVSETGGTPTIFLSGPNNFRKEIYPLYKENRKNFVRPINYDLIREHLITRHGAVVTDGMEADDAMGIWQWMDWVGGTGELNTVICTIDKDLNMIPGKHYNFVTGEMFTVSEGEATYNFYKQLLTGDSTDNIKGIPGVGEKTAIKILASCASDEHYKKAVYNAYVNYITKECKECTKEQVHKRAMSEISLNGKLLWILREPDETYEFDYEAV
jgi:hypothetical protein